MAIDYLLDVGHAAVAEFQGITIEYFPQLVARRERSVDEADELFSDVGSDVLVIWWVEPYIISSSLAILRCWSLSWRPELQFVCVTGLSQRFLIQGRCFVEDVFIR